MNFNINEEFAKLIPPLSSDEFSILEKSLLIEGCRDPLVVWNNTIIDGHHRYAICSKHGISFNYIEKLELETEVDVKLWMINNQFSRRNLPTETRLALAYRFKELEVQKAKERQGTRNDLATEELEDNFYSPVSRSKEKNQIIQKIRGSLGEIAKKAKVGYTTAFQYDAIQRKGTDEQKAEVAEGKSSIKKVYNEIKEARGLKKDEKVVHLKIKGRGLVVIQNYITGIYNELEDLNISKDLTGIRHVLLNSYLGQNDNFLACISNIDKQRKTVRQNLTRLSEAVDNLELNINQGKHLILVEVKKNKTISKLYERYYG